MSFRWSKPVVKGCRISHNTNFSIRRFDWWRQVPKDLHSIRRRSKSNQSRTGKHVSSSHILSWWLQYNSRTTSRHTSVTNNFKTFVTFLSPRLPHEGTFWYVNNRNRQLFSIPSMSAFLGSSSPFRRHASERTSLSSVRAKREATKLEHFPILVAAQNSIARDRFARKFRSRDPILRLTLAITL